MKLCLAVLLALSVAMPVEATSYMPITVITKKSIRQDRIRKRQEQAFCRKAQKAKGQIFRLGSLKQISFDRRYDYSYLLERGEDGCPKDLDLAVTLAETLVADQSLWIAPDGYMGRLHDVLLIRNLPADRERADELHRFVWLRGGYSISGTPNWSVEDRRRFAARDEVWTEVSKALDSPSNRYSLHLETVLDPLSPRYNPATAVDLLERSTSPDDWFKAARMLLDRRQVPADRQRAERLLWRSAPHTDDAALMLFDLHQTELASNDSAARQALLMKLTPIVDRNPPRRVALLERATPFYVPGLTNPDPQIQSATAKLLANFARQGTQNALPPLLGWIEPRLVSTDAATVQEARALLRMLVEAGVPAANPMMYAEYARHGGLVQGGAWTPDPAKPAAFSNYFTPNDYPVRAMREERSGVVRASAVFGPDGRVFLIEITGSSGSPDLDQAVRSTLTRRMRRSWLEHPNRFVRVMLPPIQFRLNDCDANVPQQPAVDGAVLVDAKLFCRPVY